MKVTVAILNWNGKKLLEEFLPFVVENSKEAEVIVIDNKSEDDSVFFVEKNFPSIRIIKNIGNYGYAKGYNIAIKDINTDLLVLLNSDVETSKGWLLPIIKEFEKDSNLVIAQPKILNYKNRLKFDYAGASGGFIDKLAYPYCRGRIFSNIEEDKNQYNSTLEIDWASGACFFIRKSIYEKLGGIDEDFYLHMEEIDLCLRAKSQGYKIKVIPESIVFHKGGGTLSVESANKVFYNFRNNLYLIVKNYENFILRILLRIVILDFLASISYLIKFDIKFIFAIMKAHFSFYKNFMKIYKKRNGVFFHNKHNRIILKDYYFLGRKEFKRL